MCIPYIPIMYIYIYIERERDYSYAYFTEFTQCDVCTCI